MDLKEVGEVIRQDINAGRGSRVSLGAKDAVFGVGALPPTLADYAEKASCAGMSFDATVVGPSGTKVGKVAEGAAKPSAITLSAQPVALAKYAGMATLTLERQISAQGIASAIYQALAGQALMAYEVDAVAALAGASTPATATTYLAGIAAAQATLLSSGSKPGVVSVPASLYGDVVGEVIAGPGFGTDPRSPIGTIFGSLVHVSSAASTEVTVFDPAAALAVQHEDSPLVISDPYTLAAESNTIRLVLDLVAAFVVTNAGGVAAFTKTP